MELAQIAYRIATEPAFADGLQQDPEATLKSAGMQLTEEQIEAVCDLLQQEGWQALVAPDQAIVNGLQWWVGEDDPPDKR